MTPRDLLRRTAARALLLAADGLYAALLIGERALTRVMRARQELRWAACAVDMRRPCSLCAHTFARCLLGDRGICFGCALMEERHMPCGDPACEACGPEIVS